MYRKIRSAVLVLVLVNLVATAAYALPPVGRQAPSRSEGVLAAAWEWFTSVLAPAVPQLGLQSVWEKEGSSMDPNGTTQPPVSVSVEDVLNGVL
jgi:hypothetical protein